MEASTLALQPLGSLHDACYPRTVVLRLWQQKRPHEKRRRWRIWNGVEDGRKGLEDGHGVVKGRQAQYDDGVGREKEQGLPGIISQEKAAETDGSM